MPSTMLLRLLAYYARGMPTYKRTKFLLWASGFLQLRDGSISNLDYPTRRAQARPRREVETEEEEGVPKGRCLPRRSSAGAGVGSGF